jgi:hypothetical protein
LQQLWCEHNQLSSLPIELGAIKRLVVFCCSYNPFDKGVPLRMDILRERFQRRRVCAALMFCHEATQQQQDGASAAAAAPRLGDIALDNVGDIVRIVWTMFPGIDIRLPKKVARLG